MEPKAELLARTRRRINAAKNRLGKSWQDVFGKCDKDQSGYLDCSELTEAVRTVLNVPENAICDYELRTLFNEMDQDRSGGVNIEELLNYLSQGFKTPQEIASRAQVRIQRVKKNLKTAFQTIATNESSMRKLFQKLDMDSDCTLSLYEFRTFVRMNLKLSFWDVCNTDIEDFFNFLDKDGSGIQVDELIAFVKSNNSDRAKEYSFLDCKIPEGVKKLVKKKTYKQALLEDSFRSTSMPDLSRMRYTPAVVSLGRTHAPRNRSTLSMSAQHFFNPGLYGT
jgi:Ca2+-binding EF-hand superfamily protein